MVFVFRTFETSLAPWPSYICDPSSPFQRGRRWLGTSESDAGLDGLT